MSQPPPRVTEANRRSHPRIPVERAVQIQIAGRVDAMAVTANVSAGGLFVKMPDPPPVGTRVKFALDLGARAVRGHAEVAWIRLRRLDRDGPRGMGLRIVFLLDDGARYYDRFVAENEDLGNA